MRPLLLALSLSVLTACTPDPAGAQPLPSCEWCGADEAPDSLRASAPIASADEPGERLRLTGTVYQADGTTPAPGVLVYAYHTNAKGIYPRRGDETGNARRHGYLRAWVRTDHTGRYAFDTIRPGAYPGRSDPAHIHLTIQAPNADEIWIDPVQFDDDPLLTPAMRATQDHRGGSGIVAPVRADDGTWHAVRDIIVPD